MQILLPIIYTTLFIWIIYKWSFFDIPLLPRLNLIGFFCIKLIAGFSLWAVYTYYYSKSDILYYFSKSEIIYNVIYTNPLDYFKLIFGIDSPELVQYYSKIRGWNASFETFFYNESRIMIRLNAVLRIFSFGNFHVHTVIMCFFSFIGLTAMYKALISVFKGKQMWLIFAIYFIPTVLYWSSGVLKESVLVTGLGLLLYSTKFGLELPFKKKQLFLFVFSIIILLSIKIYVLLLLLPALFSNYLYTVLKKTKLATAYLLVYIGIIIFTICIAYVNNDYNILKIIRDKQAKAISEAKGGMFLVNDHHFICVDYEKQNQLEQLNDATYKIKLGSTYMQWPLENMQDTTFVTSSTDTSSFKLLYTVRPANSNLFLTKTDPTVIAFIGNMPNAIYNSLIRPCFLKPNTAFELVAIAESQMILLFIILALLFYKKPNEELLPIIILCIVVSLSLLLLIGFTVPVFGAMVRYKLPALLLLVIALFLLIDFNKIKSKLIGNKPIANVADVK